ncbi:hypothetical protein KKB41_00940 [Patescibacteria group bacterium]|nr:hypothetical protein [Patescibacteria group bacterium]
MKKQDPFELPYLKKHFKDEEKVKEIEEKINDLPQQIKRKVMKAKEKDFENTLNEIVDDAQEKMKKWEQGSKTERTKETFKQLERLQNLRKEILFGGDKKDKKEKKSKERTEVLRQALNEPEEIEITDDMIEEEKPSNDIENKFDLSDVDTIEDNNEWFKIEDMPEVNKNFGKLEQKWFEEGDKIDEDNMLAHLEKLNPKEKEAMIAAQAKSLDMYYKKGLESMDLSWEEYESSSENIEILDERRERIENLLFNKFGYDVTRGGIWKKFNVRRKLDPADIKEFDTFIAQYNITSSAHNKHLKIHSKKFADAIEQLTPKNRSRIYIHGRSMSIKGIGSNVKA